jgi:hypothetical protein
MEHGSDEQRAILFTRNAIEPITDAVIDPELLAIPATHTAPIDTKSADTAGSSSKSLPASYKDMSVSRTNSATVDFNPFSDVIRRYFDDNDRFGAFKAMVELPRDYRTLYAFRCNHEPLHEHCRSCGTDVRDIIGVQPGDAINFDKTNILRLQTHVNNCAATLASKALEPTLLARYSNTVTWHHLLNKQMRPKKNPGKNGGPELVYNLKLNIQQLITVNLAKQRDIKCLSCPDKPIMYTLAFAEEHLLLVHGIWLPPINNNDPAIKAERASGVWNARVAGFPLAPFSTHTGRYHPDPSEYARLCGQIVQERVIGPCEDVEEYGVRSDIVIEVDCLVEDSRTAPCDNKYDEIMGRASLVVQDGLCLICANNPTYTNRQRAEPRCNHANCLHALLRSFQTAYDNSQEASTAYALAGNHIGCPDPVCNRNGRQFDNILNFTRHIVAVHRFPFRGIGSGKTLSALTFETLEDAISWAKADSPSQQKYKKKRSRADSSVSNLTETSGKADVSSGGMGSVSTIIEEDGKAQEMEGSCSKRQKV